MVLANIVYDTIHKKTGLHRWYLDLIFFPIIVLGWSALCSSEVGIGVGLVSAICWSWAMMIDLRWRSGILSHQHGGLSERVPMPIPNLVSIIEGPILERKRHLIVGSWPLEHQAEFTLFVLNPSKIRPQFSLRVELHSESSCIDLMSETCMEISCPEPGGLFKYSFSVKAISLTDSASHVHITITHADLIIRQELVISSVFSKKHSLIKSAEISRWKGGARSAFSWRGDQDLYDPATFQSVEGLRSSLALSHRFRIPSTLYLSARLSLVEEEHRAFCEHFAWNRHPEEINEFISFLKNEVSIQQDLEFPMETEKPLGMELGNHSYLHHGTHTAADQANQWTGRVWVGAGRYHWLSTDSPDSFTEQRDNAEKGKQVIREILGVETSSWASPGRVFDSETARAVEAAGVEIGSDTDASTFTSVMKMVFPHCPSGCTAFVELTKKYPGDPDDAYKSSMLKYWLHAMQRKKTAFIYMAHHHLLQYQGEACYRITEEFFDHLLRYGNGDFYLGTMTALGRYWRDVLNPTTKCIQIERRDAMIIVRNNGTKKQSRLPLEIKLQDGRIFLNLVDVEANSETFIAITESKKVANE